VQESRKVEEMAKKALINKQRKQPK